MFRGRTSGGGVEKWKLNFGIKWTPLPANVTLRRELKWHDVMWFPFQILSSEEDDLKRGVSSSVTAAQEEE